MYSSKNPRDVNVLASGRGEISIPAWDADLDIEDRIDIAEHKQRAQQHVLKCFKLHRNKKMNGYEDQIRELRKGNRRKRKQLERILQKSRLLPRVVSAGEAHTMLHQKELNQLRYDRSKLEAKARDLKTYLSQLHRIVKPKSVEAVKDRQTTHKCCVLENRLADNEMKSNMAHTIAIYYREIRCKYDKDHPKWPPRIRVLKTQLADVTTDLDFLKHAARLAIGEKSRAVKKYQKMYYHHVKQREERRRQQQELIDHIRSLKDEFVPFPDIKPPEERFRQRSPRSTYEHCLNALKLQDAFDTMQQNIPGGGNVDTVTERLQTQKTDRKKLKERVDELHEEQAKLMADVERLEQHRSLLQYGGCDLLRRHEEYVNKLRQAIEQDTQTLNVIKSRLQEHATLVTKMRAGFWSILDAILGGDRFKNKEHPTDVLKLFSNMQDKLTKLMEQARDARPEDLKEVQRPGFRHFMENEMDRMIGDDPVGRILAKNQSVVGSTRDQEDLEADMDTTIDMEEFRQALKNKSIKLYLSRCTRAKALRGVPSAMNPQYRPEKKTSNHDLPY